MEIDNLKIDNSNFQKFQMGPHFDDRLAFEYHM